MPNDSLSLFCTSVFFGVYSCRNSGGEYIFGIIYKGASHQKKQITISVEVDGVNISENKKVIELDKLYCDIGGIRTDEKGNEFTPEQGLFENSALIFPLDSESYTEYSVSVSKGNHSVSIASVNDSLYIDSVIFKLKKGDNGYNAPAEKSEYYTGNPIICEGENSLWKNSSWLVSQSDNSSYNVTPEDPVLNRVNYIRRQQLEAGRRNDNLANKCAEQRIL